MNSILLSLTYLILVRAIGIPLPPVAHDWQRYDIQDLLDLHHVMLRAAMWQDHSAQQCLSVLCLCYNFQSLFGSLQILKNIWLCYVRRTQPLPATILSLAHRLNVRLSGPREPVFPDADLSQPWSFQCQQVLDSLSATLDAAEGHVANVEPVSNMEIPQARIVVWNHMIMLLSKHVDHFVFKSAHIHCWAIPFFLIQETFKEPLFAF